MPLSSQGLDNDFDTEWRKSFLKTDTFVMGIVMVLIFSLAIYFLLSFSGIFVALLLISIRMTFGEQKCKTKQQNKVYPK